MARFSSHIFVCCNRREPGNSRGCCDPDGGERLRELMKAEVKRRGLAPLVRANKSGCLDQCELGPTVVIYPQAIWYGNVRAEDVARIVERTVIRGEVLEDLLIPDELLNAKGCVAATGRGTNDPPQAAASIPPSDPLSGPEASDHARRDERSS